MTTKTTNDDARRANDDARRAAIKASQVLRRLNQHSPEQVAIIRRYIATLKELAKLKLRPEYDWSKPNVFRLSHLALLEILGSKDSTEISMREWLRRRLGEEARKIASIPRKLEPWPSQGSDRVANAATPSYRTKSDQHPPRR